MLSVEFCKGSVEKDACKPIWCMDKEREGEADNPGPATTEEDARSIVVESINITSMTSAEEQIMKRKAHITAFQEPCMTAIILRAAQGEARKHNRIL